MSSFFSEQERIVKLIADKGLDVVLHYSGMELELWRQDKSDIYSKVHGNRSGGATQKIKDFTGVIIGDDFFESTAKQTGIFQSAFLYTKEGSVLTGDEIRVKREDEKILAYKVESKKERGQTVEIFTQYELSGITS